MCRVYEDQLNESRCKAEELQRQLNDVSAQKARALTETGTTHKYIQINVSFCSYPAFVDVHIYILAYITIINT